MFFNRYLRFLTRPQHVLLGDQGRLCAVLAATLLCAMPAAGSAPSADADTPQYPSPERSAGGLDTLRGTFDRDGALSLLTDNLRWAVDIAGRIKARDDSGFTNQQFFGIDLLKTVSTKKRDIGTLIIQLYVDRDSNAPAFRETWDFKVRQLFFNYHLTRRGGVNLRIGHIETPYGLNLPPITGGTLRQFDSFSNLGLKPDWGTSINGVNSKFVYEVALTRGSGFDYESKGDPYLVSGRIGTPNQLPFILGFSGLHGKVFNTEDESIINRTRIGIDARWQGGPIDALAQVSVGQDNSIGKPKTDVNNYFLDLSWRTPADSLLLYAQGRLNMERDSSSNGGVWTKKASLTIGAQLALARHYWLSADYEHKQIRPGPGRPDVVRFELRYRFF
jgi:hypothetical protein